MMYDLVNSPEVHTISPLAACPARGRGPHQHPDEDHERPRYICYDPNETYYLPVGMLEPVPGSDPPRRERKVIPSPPVVVLAHELGHAIGRDDPRAGDPQPGENVMKVENSLRRELGLPERMVYHPMV
jgi:hypothetical protein